MSEEQLMSHPTPQMNVLKRDGSFEPVKLQKIVKAITRSAEGIESVDPSRVAIKTIAGLYDGATTTELDLLSIQTAASLIPENGAYSKLAAALQIEVLRKECALQGIHSFSQSVDRAQHLGLVSEAIATFVTNHQRKLDAAVKDAYNRRFEFFGLQNVAKHLLLRDPTSGRVIETPQFYLLRLAVTRSLDSVRSAIERYQEFASSDDPAHVPQWHETSFVPFVLPDPGTTLPPPPPYRPLTAGMGQAVAERTVLRKKEGGSWETWGDVAHRVALGNSLLHSSSLYPSVRKYGLLRKHIANGNTLMSGRHLQHGDEDQPNRGQEVFTNCSTSSVSFLLFYLLLNGSGVGRCYDDDMMLVDWDNAPNVRCVLDSAHPDFVWDVTESRRDAIHKYGAPEGIAWFTPPFDKSVWREATETWVSSNPQVSAPASSENVIWLQVQDSREGWAKALELWETLAFEKVHKDKLLVLDFSAVRPNKSPIGGMQGRPASGPSALMNAFLKASQLKGAGLMRWKQAIYTDHYFAECVLVGGARRAARMSTKHWSDLTVLDFITVKRPIEYEGLDLQGVLNLRRSMPYKPSAFLWSSNNSVTVDDEFWALVRNPVGEGQMDMLEAHAKSVFVKLSAVRKLVGEAERADVITGEEAAQMTDVPDIPQRGARLGNSGRLVRQSSLQKRQIPEPPSGS